MKDDNDDDDDMIQNQAEAQKANPPIVNSTSASSSLCAPLLFPIKGTLEEGKSSKHTIEGNYFYILLFFLNIFRICRRFSLYSAFCGMESDKNILWWILCRIVCVYASLLCLFFVQNPSLYLCVCGLFVNSAGCKRLLVSLSVFSFFPANEAFPSSSLFLYLLAIVMQFVFETLFSILFSGISNGRHCGFGCLIIEDSGLLAILSICLFCCLSFSVFELIPL